MTPPSPEPARGFLYAGGAYAIWGLVMPVAMKLLAHVSPLEIVAHRVLWSIPLAVGLLGLQGTLAAALRHFREPRTLALAAVTATLISANWGVYVYAIGAGHAVEAALGYYINPLVNVGLGALFLGERPSRPQLVAIAIAAAGVVVLTIGVGALPWISLVLALTFGSYGLIRKVVPVGAGEGFFLEVALLTVPAILVLALAVPAPHFGTNAFETAMLIGAGPLTAVPLILFAAGARLLHFSTVGILQYSVPTLVVLIAVFAFGEPFTMTQLAAFGLIWTALAIYTATLFAGSRRARRADAAIEAQTDRLASPAGKAR